MIPLIQLRRHVLVWIGARALLILTAFQITTFAGLSYPPARRSDLVENHHGVRVADPYRWMEELDSAETRAYVAAQAKLTDSYLAKIPARETVQQRLTKLLTTKNSARRLTMDIVTSIPTTAVFSLTPSSTQPLASRARRKSRLTRTLFLPTGPLPSQVIPSVRMV